MSTIQLVYCRDNADIAEKIARDLGRTGIPFQHHTNRPDDPIGELARQVQQSEDMVVLILTDNFLRNEACMSGILAMFQTLTRQNRLLTIVADGKVSRDGGHSFEPVATQFDRVVHAIQYMNFWQTAYLDRNSGSALIPPAEKEPYEQGLDIVRGIANEIGELFSALRDAGHYTWSQFQTDDYALFFRHFGLQDWHEQYRKLTALEVENNVPPIQERAPARPVAEAPAFTGFLTPAPESEHLAGKMTHAFNGMDQLLQEIETEEEQLEQEQQAQLPAPDEVLQDRQEVLEEEPSTLEETEPQSILERLIETPEPTPEVAEAEARQMSQDAWFWLEKGYIERGMELFRLAIEQHPEQESLRAEYEKARLQFGQFIPEVRVEPEPEISEPEPEIKVAEPAPALESPTQDHAQEAASYLQMGENALSKGDYLLAKYCWDRVTELQPQFPGIYRKLALLTCDHLTDYRETAAHYLEESLAAEPGDAELHYRLGLLLRDYLDQPGQALQHFRDAVVYQPEHAKAWLALAQLTYNAGDAAEAETLYRHAIQLDPGLQSADLDARLLPPALQPEAPETTMETLEPAIGEFSREAKMAMEPEQTVKTEPRTVREKLAEPLTVLITGATSGIGRATAREFARHGHRIILTGRRDDRLDELKQTFETDFESDVHTLHFDVRNPEAVRQTLEALPEEWQNIDVLINNAGLAKGFSPIQEGSLEHWDTMIDTNIKGLLYVTRCIAPGMVKRRKGQIINVGSAAGKEVYPKGNVYCATKFAVDALTRAMRLDLHAYNIRVGQVSPGHVEETEFAITRFDGDAEKARIYDDFQPLKASDVADAIYYIATRPAHVNVQDIWLYGTQQASATVVDRSGR